MSAPVAEESAVDLTIPVYRLDGTRAGSATLSSENFGVVPNVPVMHQVVVAQLAAARAGTHSTKTRAEVRGGGSKPWRQKGTGRARQGSTRAPQFTGGGSVFGPRPRSYEQRTPKKMRKLALRSALSDRASESRVFVLEAEVEVPHTRAARRCLAAIGCTGRALVVVADDDANLSLSFRNLLEAQTIVVGELSTYDVLRNDWLVFTPASLAAVEGVESVTIDRSTAEEEKPDEPEPEKPVGKRFSRKAAVEDDAGEGRRRRFGRRGRAGAAEEPDAFGAAVETAEDEDVAEDSDEVEDETTAEAGAADEPDVFGAGVEAAEEAAEAEVDDAAEGDEDEEEDDEDDEERER